MTRNSGTANGLDKLVLTNLNAIEDQSVQNALRQIQTWANNLATANPKAGQVLTATTRPRTKNGPQAEWATSGGLKYSMFKLQARAKNTYSYVNHTHIGPTTYHLSTYTSKTGFNPVSIARTTHFGLFTVTVDTPPPSFGILTFQFSLRADTRTITGTTKGTLQVAWYFNNTAFTSLGRLYGYANTVVIPKITGGTEYPSTANWSGGFTRLISNSHTTLSLPTLALNGSFNITTVGISEHGAGTAFDFSITVFLWVTMIALS